MTNFALRESNRRYQKESHLQSEITSSSQDGSAIIMFFEYSRGSGIIVGAMAIEGMAYDGHTLKPQPEQVKELTGGRIKKAIVDKGYQIKGGIHGVDIVMPKNLKRESYYL